MSESKFQLPENSEQKENNDAYTFRIERCNVSIINAIRRTLLSDIDTIGFKTEPYNDSNEKFVMDFAKVWTKVMNLARF